MLRAPIVGWGLAVTLLVSGAGSSSGQTTSTGSGQAYPNRPIRIITSPPGGGSDLTARIIAQGITVPLGQPVIVDNRNDTVTGEMVAKAATDGYTLLLTGNLFWIGPLLEKISYDPVKDFSPISLVTASPLVLAVQPSFPAKSVTELIAVAKAKPGVLNYASTGTGGVTHLAAELFKSMAGVNIVRIPYKGGPQALNDLVAGAVQLMFPSAGTAAPYLKSGKLVALAVTSVQPSALVPGVPTMTAAGLRDFDAEIILAVFAPAKTPAAIINRLQQETARTLNRRDVKDNFFNAGVETVASSPQELAAWVRSDIARLGKVIKDAGIRAD